jgi:oligopeptide/dipeptide ABC transporter ATP-binding protein
MRKSRFWGGPMALLEITGLTKYHQRPRGILSTLMRRPTEAVHAVDGVSLTVDRGEMLALVGESGCGKTTTAQTILRLLDPMAGQIRFEGQDITGLSQRQLRPLRRRMQVVYQDPYESLDPRFRVGQTLEEPLRIHRIGGSVTERRELVKEMLARVDLTPPEVYIDRYPHELSGGQRQRVAIAAALAVKPQLLIADEPVSMLDVSVRAGIMNLLQALCREDGMSVLMITHDLAIAGHVADRIAVMYMGRVVETGVAKEVLHNPKHPYTQALCAVAPRHRRVGRPAREAVLGGEPANAVSIPSGCRFRPRCPRAEERCEVEDPQLLQLADRPSGHSAACLLADHW